jgi:hypothetical protein
MCSWLVRHVCVWEVDRYVTQLDLHSGKVSDYSTLLKHLIPSLTTLIFPSYRAPKNQPGPCVSASKLHSVIDAPKSTNSGSCGPGRDVMFAPKRQLGSISSALLFHDVFFLKFERRSKKLIRNEIILHDEESESSVTRTFIYDARFPGILLREEEAETLRQLVETPLCEAVAEEDEFGGMGIE